LGGFRGKVRPLSPDSDQWGHENNVDLAVESHSATVKSDSNDWSKNPNGESYLQAFDTRGVTPEVRQRIDDLRRGYAGKLKQAIDWERSGTDKPTPTESAAGSRGVESAPEPVPTKPGFVSKTRTTCRPMRRRPAWIKGAMLSPTPDVLLDMVILTAGDIAYEMKYAV